MRDNDTQPPRPGSRRIRRIFQTSRYYVSDTGEVYYKLKRSDGYRRLATRRDQKGYPIIRLTINGTRHWCKIAHLVAAAFLGPRPPGMLVLHGDDNKENNTVPNLRYGTAKENADDREKNGRTAKGEAVGTSKLMATQVLAIRASRKSKSMLSRIYDVSRATIRHIRWRQTWRHILGVPERTIPKKGMPRSRLRHSRKP